MKRAGFSIPMTVAAMVALAATCLQAARAPSVAQSGKRTIHMEIVGRKDLPPFRVFVREGETVTLEHKDLGKFEFTPSFRKDDDAVIIVTIADAGVSPTRHLGEVEVPVDGTRVQSKTSPEFGLRILRVTVPK